MMTKRCAIKYLMVPFINDMSVFTNMFKFVLA